MSEKIVQREKEGQGKNTVGKKYDCFDFEISKSSRRNLEIPNWPNGTSPRPPHTQALSGTRTKPELPVGLAATEGARPNPVGDGTWTLPGSTVVAVAAGNAAKGKRPATAPMMALGEFAGYFGALRAGSFLRDWSANIELLLTSVVC